MAQNAWTGLAQSTAHLPALGLGMKQMQERNEDREQLMGMRRDYNVAQQQNQAAIREEAKARLEAEQAKLPVHRQPMNPSDIPLAKLSTQKKFGKTGLDAMNPIWEMVDPIATAKGTTKQDAYVAVKGAWPTLREEITANLEKSLSSGKLTPEEQKRIGQLYDIAKQDETGELFLDKGVFSNTARSMKMEEENSKAALQAERIAGQNERSERTDTRIRDLAAENMELKRDRENRLGQPKPEKVDKSLKEAVGRIDRTIAEYERKIKNYQIEARNAKSDKDVKWYQDAIDALEEQVSIAKETRGGVQGGTIPVESINWGGQPATKADTTGAPKVGEVRKGYKFKGGDPADQNSWEKI